MNARKQARRNQNKEAEADRFEIWSYIGRDNPDAADQVENSMRGPSSLSRLRVVRCARSASDIFSVHGACLHFAEVVTHRKIVPA